MSNTHIPDEATDVLKAIRYELSHNGERVASAIDCLGSEDVSLELNETNRHLDSIDTHLARIADALEAIVEKWSF